MPSARILVALLAGALCLMAGSSLAQANSQHRDNGVGEAVSFKNGADRLHGSVLLPSGPGPHPAFVAIQGSGAGSYRDSWAAGYFPFWKDVAEFLVARGYAVLLFDKPGVNESAGDWRRQSFDDRATEVVAAVRALAARSDIDPARVGVIGHSQGGWVAQIAAARHPEDVAFVIMLAGPAVSVKEQIRDDVESGWACGQHAGVNLAVRRTALRLGLNGLDLVARVAKPGYLSRIIHFDPQAVLADISQPMLALFGEYDPLVLPESNRVRLEHGFGTERGNTRLAIATVPGADHFFRDSTHCPSGRPPAEWAPGLFPALGDAAFWSWIEERASGDR